MKSVMEHTFSRVPTIDIPRSSFDRSHGHKTSMDADHLVPILIDDIIPGDTFNVNANIFARLTSPTILPIMDNMFLDTFFFFVPYRLLWDNWEKFLGAQEDPGDSIDYTIPVISGTTAIDVGHVGNYMGLPRGWKSDEFATISALPFRAYALIYNEWFRDQNLQDSVPLQTTDGPDNETYSRAANAPHKRGKRHDYFTSCLPWPQKGTAVDIPVTGTIPIRGTSNGTHVESTTGTDYGELVTNNNYIQATSGPSGVQPIRFSDDQTEVGLEAVVTSGGLGTINDIRLAFQTQRLLERDARSGTRYVETLKAHWGVQVPDFRLQRPEYLGGGSTPISIAPVAQTTFQGTQTIEDGKGTLSGIGTVGASHGFSTSFVEHGVLVGLANVRSDITYSQGIERQWEKRTRYDFYYPVLAQIGEQAVLNREIYFAGGSAEDDQVFGYQERYAEYRYKPSRITGKLAPTAYQSLHAFHLSEEFTGRPTLGDSFIQSNTATPLDDVISVPSEPQFVVDIYFQMNCARPMPLYGVPGNMDHF